MFVVLVCLFFFFVKQKTAYEMRISDWSSDVCSSDLIRFVGRRPLFRRGIGPDRCEGLILTQIVDQDIDAAKSLDRCLHHLCGRRIVTKVAKRAGRSSPSPFDGSFHHFGPICVAAIDDDFHTFLSEHLCRRRANSCTAAGIQCALSLGALVHASPFPPFIPRTPEPYAHRTGGLFY